MFFYTKTASQSLSKSIIIVMVLFATLCFGCAGTRGAGALGGGSHAAMFRVDANQEVAWKAFKEVLKDDPTLFQVESITEPGVETEAIVRGKKGMYVITIWVLPQGKSMTSFEVQAGLLTATDSPTQVNLANAIAAAMNKKLTAKPR